MVMLKKVCLELSISIGSNLLVIPYGDTINENGKEIISVILHMCKLIMAQLVVCVANMSDP